MAVLHLLRGRIPDVPVLFLDTGYHFPQTYEYRDRMAKEWSLHLVNVLPTRTVPEQESAFRHALPDRSDTLLPIPQGRASSRRTGALRRLFTGLRREQSPTRKNLKKVELHRLPTAKPYGK